MDLQYLIVSQSDVLTARLNSSCGLALQDSIQVHPYAVQHPNERVNKHFKLN